MNDIAKIDSHLHINFRGYDIAKINSLIKKNNLKKIWLHTWEEFCPNPDSSYLNLKPDDILKAKEYIDAKVHYFYAPDPHAGNIEKKIDYIINNGFSGCGELKIRSKWKNQVLEKFLDIINYHKLPLLFHMENSAVIKKEREIFGLDYILRKSHKINYFIQCKKNLLLHNKITYLNRKIISLVSNIQNNIFPKSNVIPGYLDDIDGLDYCLSKFQNIKFIGHGPMFWKEIENDAATNTEPSKNNSIVNLLKKHNNLYADLSAKSGYLAISRNKQYSTKFIKIFQDKLLYGTDNFNLGLDKLIYSLGLKNEVMNKVFYKNADDFL